MLNFASRNLKMYYRQPGSVFFSLMAVFIIIGLYLLFLGDVWTKSFPSQIVEAKTLMATWLVAGIISVASLTTSMGAFEMMVSDKERKISKDFFASPLKRSTLVGGYVLSSFVVASAMSLLMLILGEIYIVANGGSLMSFQSTAAFVGVLLLSALSSCSFVFFIVSFMDSISAFSTGSTVIGTLCGFFAGLYIPLGELPESVQIIGKILPFSHAGALLRQIIMKEQISVSFAGIPAEYTIAFKERMGVLFTYGDYTATPVFHITALMIIGVLFFLLALWNVSRKKV